LQKTLLKVLYWNGTKKEATPSGHNKNHGCSIMFFGETVLASRPATSEDGMNARLMIDDMT